MRRPAHGRRASAGEPHEVIDEQDLRPQAYTGEDRRAGARLHPTRALARSVDPAGAHRLMWTAVREIAAAERGLESLVLSLRLRQPAARARLPLGRGARGLGR